MARRPQNWHGVIGQRRLVSLVLKYANGSRRRGTTFPNIGIYGPAGIGKSLFIRALVAELGVDLHPIDASCRLTEGYILETLEQAKAGDVVHIDEAHALSQAMQTRLLSPVGEERKIHRNQVAFSEGTGISVADFCLAISTTNPGQLIKPLRSRLKLNITLDLYSLSEIREIIGRICENQRLRLSTQAITLLAQASRGNPRRAGQFGRLMSDYYADLDEELSKNRVAAYLEHHGVDLKTMLDNLEQRYLCALLNQGHPVSLYHLAEILTGGDQLYLLNQCEPVLIREGFVEVVARGRQLTAKGKETAIVLVAKHAALDDGNIGTDADEDENDH